jgi:hypothetical protein
MSRAWKRMAMVLVLACGCAAASAQMVDPTTGIMVDAANDPSDYMNLLNGQPTNASLEAITQMEVQQQAAATAAHQQAFDDFVNSSIQANQNLANQNQTSQNDTPPAPAIPQVAAPALMPSGGSFQGQVMVTILDRDPDAALHYTLDGSKPTANSPDYAGSFAVNSTTKVRVLAVEDGERSSGVVTKTFKIKS